MNNPTTAPAACGHPTMAKRPCRHPAGQGTGHPGDGPCSHHDPDAAVSFAALRAAEYTAAIANPYHRAAARARQLADQAAEIAAGDPDAAALARDLADLHARLAWHGNQADIIARVMVMAPRPADRDLFAAWYDATLTRRAREAAARAAAGIGDGAPGYV